MRLNKFLAENTPLSRRSADTAIAAGHVTLNGQKAILGTSVEATDEICLYGQRVVGSGRPKTLVMLHKPVGYVCSRNGQGSPTVYDLLPEQYRALRTVGRLDKDSSGLLLLTDDGELANRLTHPRYVKHKRYQVILDKPLADSDKQHITQGVQLSDGPSSLQLQIWRRDGRGWIVVMHEGRNRQIRRTFAALGYKVQTLHRTSFGSYTLDTLELRDYTCIDLTKTTS